MNQQYILFLIITINVYSSLFSNFNQVQSLKYGFSFSFAIFIITMQSQHWYNYPILHVGTYIMHFMRYEGLNCHVIERGAMPINDK